jgi:hypothetical protein
MVTTQNEILLFELVGMMLKKLKDNNVPLTESESLEINKTFDEIIENNQIQK